MVLDHSLICISLIISNVEHLFCMSFFLFFFFFVFCLFKAAPEAYGGSQARDLIGAVAAGHSHSKAISEPPLGPTPQLTATLDP